MKQPNNRLLMQWALIAMGDGNELMREYRFCKRMGWLETPETIQKRSEQFARKLVWC